MLYSVTMIIAYIGLEGSGKSYHMAEVCQEALARGMDCFGTTPFRGARVIESHRQMLRMEGAHVFFDEWHQDLDAKEWWKLDPVLRHIVSQHRKYGLTIHWSAQDYFFMDPFVRRETSFVWQHEALYRDPMTGRSKIVGKIPFIGQVYGLHRARKYNAIDIERKHRAMESLAGKTFFVKKSICDTYDSFKKIMLTSDKVSDEELCAIKDPYLSPTIENPMSEESKMTHKRNLNSLGGEILRVAAPGDDVEDEHAQAVADKARLDRQPQPHDLKKRVHRKNKTKDRKPALKVGDPSEGGSREGLGDGQQQCQGAEQPC